jgi:RNA polymerase-binding transcription factor DksA
MVKSKAGKANKKKTVKTVKKVEKKNTQPKAKKVTKKVEPTHLTNGKSSVKKVAKKATVKATKSTAKKSIKKSSPKSAKVTKTTKTAVVEKKKTVSFPKSVLEGFRKILNIEKFERIREIESLNERMDIASSDLVNENSIYSLHMADQGTDAMEREKNYLFAQRNDVYIKQLDEALKRIDDGTYGVCTVCGKLIEKKRLEAVPTTQKHVDCKNKEKRMGAGNIISE